MWPYIDQRQKLQKTFVFFLVATVVEYVSDIVIEKLSVWKAYIIYHDHQQHKSLL